MPATVSQYMQKTVHSAAPDDTLEQLEQKLASLGVGGVPVLEGERLVGVVSRTDVLRALVADQTEAGLIAEYYRDAGWPALAASDRGAHRAEQLQHRRVREIMSTALLTIAPHATLKEAARLMLDKHVHRLLATENKRLVGILTSGDILRSIVQGE